MRLTDWAAAPLWSPPPIPIATDTVSATNMAFRVGAIPAAALADDLAALGLTYSLGRGNGYRRHGVPIDSYLVGDLIADTFRDAALVLDYFLDTDPAMHSIGVAREQLSRLPYRDRDEARAEERRRVSDRITDAERDLPLTYTDLALARVSLSETARSIRGLAFVRTEAVRRFRSVIPAPTRPGYVSPAALSAFFSVFEAGELIARPALHDLATEAGLAIGSRTLYAAAEAHGWQGSRRNGLAFYRVPPTP